MLCIADDKLIVFVQKAKIWWHRRFRDTNTISLCISLYQTAIWKESGFSFVIQEKSTLLKDTKIT